MSAMALAARASEPCSTSALLGAVVARSASYQPERVAETAFELLALRSEERVLELGCGSGRLLFRLAARVRRGHVVGIDPSELMVRHARHRNRRFVEEGRAAIAKGRSTDLSAFPDGGFDAVLGVHVVCFWTDPHEELAQVRRVLAKGGRLLLAFSPGQRRLAPDAANESAHVPVERVVGWLEEAGFEELRVVVAGTAGHPLAWVRGRR
jgi:ubiquinone/menaquinone biosynthesis C-methylase UbiE